ncbi:metallophosphoesterase [Haliovirga abyssi]|uniref:Phosphoesterase n=1 Tax=Haliovirga abyssi TaxID=2996794 RepID=A0AAU9E4B9_9FUSO|nr:metallophosphoesterase [Haliovirga abyssi]BDU51345.1 phosphoesterase [Haliovirga abyssi]
MAKILVISDSHGKFDKIHKMVEKEKPDYIIFTGDHSKDGIELSYLYNDKIKFYIVKGNTDYMDRDSKEELEIQIDGFKFLLTHGHLYGVKRGYDNLKLVAEKKKVDVVIFGHTHNKYYEKYKNIEIFNPGAAQDGNYGIIEIEGDKIKFMHKGL